ncbi:hypothetical protein BST43_24995, partial [Mycobacteroides saopaulense]
MPEARQEAPGARAVPAELLRAPVHQVPRGRQAVAAGWDRPAGVEAGWDPRAHKFTITPPINHAFLGALVGAVILLV